MIDESTRPLHAAPTELSSLWGGLMGYGIRRWLLFVLYEFAIPALIYGLSFFLLTYPLLFKFSTQFYCSEVDGPQNEWNIWWIRKAIVELHQSPWFTTWLHAPQGTTLIGHTLNLVNGLIGIPLSFIFSRVQVYNLIVVGTFVSSGVTAFWLARHVAKLYVAALFGGFAFTFTGYHFAQASGHMELISMEFIPLFLLAWVRMVERPGIWRAIAAGVTLGLVPLCDFYYVFYCILAGAICVGCYATHLWRLARRNSRSRWQLPLYFGLFVLVASLCCGPFIIPLLITNARDPFVGAHNAATFSADAFSAFIPGGANLLGRFTKIYWVPLTGNVSEQCVYVGLSVLAVAIYGSFRHRGRRVVVSYWRALAFWSYILSLGPFLQVHGVRRSPIEMPYSWLVQLLPLLKLGGVPSRISVMLALALSVLMSLGIRMIWRRHGRKSVVLIGGIAVVMAIDLWPDTFQTIPVTYPQWTIVLRDLPIPGPVVTKIGDMCQSLYYQTLYNRPMAQGYMSRYPRSVSANDHRIDELVRVHDFAALRAMGFVYIVLSPREQVGELPIVYSDDVANIWQLPNLSPLTTYKD